MSINSFLEASCYETSFIALGLSTKVLDPNSPNNIFCLANVDLHWANIGLRWANVGLPGNVIGDSSIAKS